MAFPVCSRCNWPSTSLNDFGVCRRCWKAPEPALHGPESPDAYAARQKREAREAAQREKRAAERQRKDALEYAANYRRHVQVAQSWIDSADDHDRRGLDSALLWLEAAEACARTGELAYRTAEFVPAHSWRFWMRRAAHSAAVSSQCSSRATREVRRLLKIRKGPGLEVLAGGGKPREASAPPLRLRIIGKVDE